MKISILIPAYNEEKKIGKTLISLLETLEKTNWVYEIIVICDGGQDRTYPVANQYSSAQVKIFGYPQNRGKGYALKYGFHQAEGNLIIFFDAGLEMDPGHILTIVDFYDKTKIPVIIGSKRHPDSRVLYPWKRQVLSRAAQLMVKMLFAMDVRDSQVGLKLFKHEVLAKIFPKVLVKKFAFDIELLALAHHYGYPIAEVPVDLKMDFGHSSVNLKSVKDSFLDTLAIFYRLQVLKYYDKPRHVREEMLKKYAPK